jgi:hypothetical protein
MQGDWACGGCSTQCFRRVVHLNCWPCLCVVNLERVICSSWVLKCVGCCVAHVLGGFRRVPAFEECATHMKHASHYSVTSRLLCTEHVECDPTCSANSSADATLHNVWQGRWEIRVLIPGLGLQIASDCANACKQRLLTFTSVQGNTASLSLLYMSRCVFWHAKVNCQLC